MKNYDYEEVLIPADGVNLIGDLTMPGNSKAMVIFSHGSGSSRRSPRNKMVAQYLHEHGMGTLLFDLLTKEEDQSYSNRFNIGLLASRLVAATQWFEAEYGKGNYLGYFGASTGAASALRAAADLPAIKAVVSRGGRPDMADEALEKVTSPVLLIVGSLDYDVLRLNEYAYQRLHCEKKLRIINGATHLFEEPGTLEQAADAAALWFEKYLLLNATTNESNVQRQD